MVVKRKLALLILLLLVFSAPLHAATDAQSNGVGWISLGIPRYVHIGTDGDGSLHLNGTDQGKCGNVYPTYFRVNMNDTRFKEFYSWLLLMAAQKKTVDCVVNSGCGTSQVWVKYCRGSLE